MSGGGNDFIILEDVALKKLELKKLASELCKRGHSIGADGLIYIAPSKKADFFYWHFNSDGSVANICGNGSRCVALYAYKRKIANKRMTFETPAGIFSAEVSSNLKTVKVDFIPAKNLRLNIPINIDENFDLVHFIDVGVPHTIVFVEKPNEIDVNKTGKKICFHPEFHPQGTNVNFIKVKDRKNIKIRTYERGVESETLACGTGSISSAIVSGALNKITPPVSLHTSGGSILVVDFQLQYDSNSNPCGANKITLTGEAKFVFEGTIKI